nr:MAG TPA: hypothetical protein [Caudoviricetes sp.]
MNIYEVLVIVTFIMVTIMMISRYIDSCLATMSDVLELLCILPCYEIKVYRNGKLLKTTELPYYLSSPVKKFKCKDGIFYIELY